MSAKELQRLFEEYVKTREEFGADSRKAIQLRNRIVVKNRALARDIAHRMSVQCPEPYEDLEQLASIGLIKAVEKFDPARGVAFSSFAVPYIRGEIQHFLRDDFGGGAKVPRREIELSSRAMRVSRICGIEMDETVIARGLKVNSQKLSRSLEARTRKPVKSLDHEVLHPPAAEEAPIERDCSWIKGNLALLPEPYLSIVMARYLLNRSEARIARDRKMPVAAVQEMLAAGLLKLKQSRENNDNSNPCPGV